MGGLVGGWVGSRLEKVELRLTPVLVLVELSKVEAELGNSKLNKIKLPYLPSYLPTYLLSLALPSFINMVCAKFQLSS